MRDEFLKDQKAKLAKGGISRRQFVTAAVAAGLALPTALSMADQVLAAKPKKGGTFRLGFSAGSTTETLDSLSSEGSTNILNIGFCIGNQLTEVASDGSLVPELAESYESDDATSWYFKLRQGVEFHNGKTLTTEDVIASLNRHRGPDTKSAMKSLLSSVEDIKDDNGKGVRVQLSSPNADFPFLMSDYHLGIHFVDKDGQVNATDGIGTGGYVVKEYEAGVSASFTRNPNYFKPDRAHFDEVQTLVILDTAARQNALATNEVDAMDNADPKTVDRLAKSPGVNILELTGTQQRYVAMRLDTPPFDNKDLRLALKYAVKREELVNKLLRGHGALGNDHHISPTQQYWNSELPQREFDADKARFHLKKAGMEGTTFELNASDAALVGSIQAAELIQASASECGIDMKVVRKPSDGFWASVWNQKGIGMVTSYWGGRPTNDWMYSACCTADSSWNDTAFVGTPAADRFNQLVIAARAELDDNKRREMYWECQKILNEDGGSIVWAFSNYLTGMRDSVKTPERVAANWSMDGGKAAERWWFG